ncbi:hypothetical protein HFO77_29345 [Rhizobium leguminosarum]|nr:hypothetical protein [Rhizobium leguminosarum]
MLSKLLPSDVPRNEAFGIQIQVVFRTAGGDKIQTYGNARWQERSHIVQLRLPMALRQTKRLARSRPPFTCPAISPFQNLSSRRITNILGRPDGLLRMSVGLEAKEDLIDDLTQSLSLIA